MDQHRYSRKLISEVETSLRTSPKTILKSQLKPLSKSLMKRNDPVMLQCFPSSTHVKKIKLAPINHETLDSRLSITPSSIQDQIPVNKDHQIPSRIKSDAPRLRYKST